MGSTFRYFWHCLPLFRPPGTHQDRPFQWTPWEILSPPLPPVDSNFVNGVNEGQGQIRDVLRVRGFPQAGPDGPFLDFFKDDLKPRVLACKKGTRELANLACTINFDRPSSSNLSLSFILLKDHPTGLLVRQSLKNSPLTFSPQC
ncbi:hypothetical protein AMTRI_Chr10g231230 [Amborella trichopoda]